MIHVTITLKELREADACREGRALFHSLRKMQGRQRSVRIEWTPLAQVWLAAAFGEFSNWLYQNKLTPRLSLEGVDLRGADLSGADLRGAYLRGAYLSGADLRGAYLRGAYLSGAYLSGAYLRGADLSGADLSGADLSGADLSGAYLRGAYLSGAYLSGAYRPSVSWGYSDLPDGWERDAFGYLRRPEPKPQAEAAAQ
jgi:uncharacterized protein YjbI with pentapeptide repeats